MLRRESLTPGVMGYAGNDPQAEAGSMPRDSPGAWATERRLDAQNQRPALPTWGAGLGALGLAPVLLLGAAMLREARPHLVQLAVQLLDRELGLDVHLVVLVRLQPVLRGLAVLAHHDHRRLQRGEARQDEVEENVGEGIGRRVEDPRG